MAERQKEGPKKRSGKSKKGKSSGDAGKLKFSAGTPPTACTREPPSLSPPKLNFQLQPIDLSDDPPVVSPVPIDLPADPRHVGPFQGQDGSPEPITQAGTPRQSEVDQAADSHGDSTGAPPRASTVELSVSTQVSRRRSDADMESLTRQMADEKAFREQRTKKTEAMLVSFLAKAKGAPPAVLEAWGISPSKEPSSPVRSVTARPEQPSSVSGKQKHKDRSSGNRDESSPRRKGRDSRGSRRSRTPQVDARVLAGASNQPVRGRSRDPHPNVFGRNSLAVVPRVAPPRAEVTHPPADVLPGGEALTSVAVLPARTEASARSRPHTRRSTWKGIGSLRQSISAGPTSLHPLEDTPSRSTTPSSAVRPRDAVGDRNEAGRGRTGRTGSPPPLLCLLSLRSRRGLPPGLILHRTTMLSLFPYQKYSLARAGRTDHECFQSTLPHPRSPGL